MKKEDLNNILLANNYLISCKLQTNCCEKKTNLARKYLSNKINKALNSKTEESPTNFKAILISILPFLGFSF